MRLVFALAAFAFSAPAFATCRIHNDTGESFTIASGNVSNQRIGSHTTSSIASGNVSAKSDKGVTVTGSCKDGSSVEIKMEGGKIVLKSK